MHGGAGAISEDDDPVAIAAGCLAAARAGQAVLAAGGSALDAVIAAVVVMEDDPQFNAGLGSMLTARGEGEMGASVMRGADGAAGAVGCLTGVKHPMLLARRVMERTPHVLLVGAGAREFAVEQGVPLLPPGALVTERARARWEKKRTALGTVGAVARDAKGHVAAATSTGGTALKRPGRIGDTPLIGCGTYADDALGACSCTGLGEAIIKATLARQAVETLSGGSNPDAVARKLVEVDLKRYGVGGGLIVVNAKGRIGFAFNTPRMARAWVDDAGVEGSGFGK